MWGSIHPLFRPGSVCFCYLQQIVEYGGSRTQVTLSTRGVRHEAATLVKSNNSTLLEDGKVRVAVENAEGAGNQNVYIPDCMGGRTVVTHWGSSSGQLASSQTNISSYLFCRSGLTVVLPMPPELANGIE
jgi:hypothetical protein